MNIDCDIFISHHGDEKGAFSSYEKANELKEFFENHAIKPFKCFLCKRENVNDFYDAIQKGILTAKHFILVANDRDGIFLSQWVADEVKQFDGLRKLGKKPNSIINAYLYGSITVDDLIEFNPVFSTKDIANKETGFEKLYDQIYDAEVANKPVSFRIREGVKNFVFASPINPDFRKKIHAFLSGAEDEAIFERKIIDDLTAFELFFAKEMLVHSFSSDEFILFQVVNPHFVAEQLLSSETQINRTVLLFDYQNEDSILLIDGNLIQIRDICDFNVICNDRSLLIREEKIAGKSVLALQYGDMQIDIPYNGFDIEETVSYRRIETASFSSWEKCPTEYSNIKIAIYYLSLVKDIIKEKNEMVAEEIEGEIEVLGYELSDGKYEKNDIERSILEQVRSSITLEESLLREYFLSLKAGKTYDDAKSKKLFSSRYCDVAYYIKDFYSTNSTESLSRAMDMIYDFAMTELNVGVYSRYEVLVFMLFELSIYNVFLFDDIRIAKWNLHSHILKMIDTEYLMERKLKLLATNCAYKKELVFGGMLEEQDYSSAVDNLLKEFEHCIELIERERSIKDREDYFNDELLLLYRQRCVIWENRGDHSFKQSDRLKYYSAWRTDCEKAIGIASRFDCDKETLGCVYLNLASSYIRLFCIKGNSSKIDIDKCLEYLDAAEKVLKVNSARRYIGYIYLHRSDYYGVKLNLLLSAENADEEMIREIATLVKKNATYALNIFKNTEDNIAKSSAIRLQIKGKIFSADSEDLISSIRLGVKQIREALSFCKKARFVNGVATCISDLTTYIGIIEKKGVYDELADEIKDVFVEEMKVLSSIIKLLELDKIDILEMQEQMEKLIIKLID